jgi:hypothetical protein
MPKETLEEEAKIVTEMLKGKVVRKVWRHRAKEIVIVFEDETTLYVDHQPEELEISITDELEDD